MSVFTKIKTHLPNLQETPPTPHTLLSEAAVDKVGEELLKWMIEVDKVGGGCHIVIVHCLLPPWSTPSDRLLRTLRSWWLWVGRELTPFFLFFIFLPRCPNIIPVPGEKRPLTLPQAPGCQPICWGKRRGADIFRRRLENQLEDPCSQGDTATRLRRHDGSHG